MSIRRESGFFTGSGRHRPQIFWRNWRPESVSGQPVILAHGLSEHSDNYAHVANYLAERGIPVWALDHCGHGRSGGPRVYVEQFSHYMTDLGTLVDRVMAAEGCRPALVGHSMGGLISLAYALRRPTSLCALAVASPWLRTRTRVPWSVRLFLPVLARVTPRLRVPNHGDFTGLSRDPAVHARYAADPLRCREATPRWFHESIKAQRWVLGSADRLQLPVLFLVAGSDPLVDPEATAAFFQQVTSPDKTYIDYPDRLHEVFNDTGYLEVLETLYQWLDARCRAVRETAPGRS